MEFLSKTQRCKLTSLVVDKDSFVRAREERLQESRDIMGSTSLLLALRYAIDDFGFKEEGAVLGCANECVDHSRTWLFARGTRRRC